MMEASLIKKLKIKSNHHVLVYDAPNYFIEFLESLDKEFSFDTKIHQQHDVILLFVKTSNELISYLKELHQNLNPDTLFWIIYPKKDAGIPTDLSMMGSWEELNLYHLRPVASAAIDFSWTALQIKPTDKVKKSKTSNEGISNSDYVAFIDTKNRTITLPEEISLLLDLNPTAFHFYNTLSYTNKKEYLLWLITAKQEKTKLSRQKLFVEKLLEGKKNPSEK